MPKFMTYQRPTPVNKAGWGKPGANPHQRVPTPRPHKPAAPVLPNGIKAP